MVGHHATAILPWRIATQFYLFIHLVFHHAGLICCGRAPRNVDICQLFGSNLSKSEFGWFMSTLIFQKLFILRIASKDLSLSHLRWSCHVYLVSLPCNPISYLWRYSNTFFVYRMVTTPQRQGFPWHNSQLTLSIHCPFPYFLYHKNMKFL